MSRVLLIIILAIGSIGNLFGKTVLKNDFTAIKLDKANGNCRVCEGALVLTSTSTQNASLKLELPDAKGNLKISLKVRQLEKPKGDNFWGMSFSGAEKSGVFLYSRGTDITALLRAGKNVIFHDKLSGSGNFKFKLGKNTPWTKVVIYLTDKGIEANLDGKFAGRLKCKLLPLRAITFSAWYGNKVEIDDLEVTKMKAALTATGHQRPVFHARFNKNTTAKNISGAAMKPSISKNLKYVRGVSGQAVNLGKDNQQRLTLNSKWHNVSGILKVSDNLNSLQRVVLDLPELKEFVLKYKVKRLKATPKGDQFGFFLRGSGEQVFRLYSNPSAGFLHIVSEKDKQVKHSLLKPRMKLPRPGSNSPWQTIKAEVNAEGVRVTVDGKELEFSPCKVTPVTKIEFYAYGLDMAIDDITITGFEVDGTSFKYVEDFSDFQTGTPELSYHAEKLFKNRGTLSFWMRSDIDGLLRSDDLSSYDMFSAFDPNNISKLKMFMWWWLRVDIGRIGNMAPVSIRRSIRNNIFRNDWNHIALVWDDGNWCKLFVNGLPYLQGNDSVDNKAVILSNIDLKSISCFQLGTGAFDELKIYDRPLSDAEVLSEYRNIMPVDLMLDRAAFLSDSNEQIVLSVAPGGYYMRPLPVKVPLTKAKIKLKMQLLTKGKVLKEADYDLNVNSPQELKLPVGKLPMGEYRVKCEVEHDGKYAQQSFLLTSYKPEPLSKTSSQDIKLGQPFFVKNCADMNLSSMLNQGGIHIVDSPLGKYLEGGNANGNRFAFEIPFSEKFFAGRPVLLEITWPDDKPRSMAFYMYPESAQEQHRERLEGGVQSGIEYPLTEKMQKSCYLFYPGVKRYLFEARSMINGFSAAVESVKVYPVLGRLPKLAINYPEGTGHRHFGYMDEDQTFDIMFNHDDNLEKKSVFRTANVIDRFCDYLDYTGQDIMAYPLQRYWFSFYPQAGYCGNGLFPFRPGEIPLLIEMLNRRGKKFIAITDFFTLPEMHFLPDKAEEFEKSGYTMNNVHGQIVKKCGSIKANHANPKVQDLFVRHVKEIAKRYGNMPGFLGIDWWISSLGTFNSLQNGYDDYTAELFSKETGIKIPSYKGAARFSQRYEFLAKGNARDPWLRWRAAKTTQLVKKVRAMLDKINPELKLYLSVDTKTMLSLNSNLNDIDVSNYCYQKNGIDIKTLQTIHNVYIVGLRDVTTYRWDMHWGKKESSLNENLYNRKTAAEFKNAQNITYSNIYPTYFETFEKSLKQDVFKAYFQNADVKPFGRYFLKELAFNVAATDSLRILIGAQPVGSWGRDEVTREFARAYCSLPDKPFHDVPGSNDPVTVRILKVGNRTYFYAVSQLWSDCEATLTLSGSARITDLSTGEKMASEGNTCKIKLKSYQLRSFRCDNRNLVITNVKTVVPQNVKKFYKKRMQIINNALDKLKRVEDCSAAIKSIKKISNLISRSEFAEVHRLCFASPINQLIKKSKNINNLAEQNSMMKNNRYAVDCGANNYYRAPDGRLFFPDKKFDNGGKYGYVGSCKSVNRNIDKIKDKSVPGVFRSEIYDFDGYRFKVADGTYRVKIYFKVGYEPGAKPGVFVFTVKSQGKEVLKDFDVFKACNNDFNQTVVKEIYPVKAKDGFINIQFVSSPGKEPSARLCNAIEIEKIK
jgi:hypothetical protein